MWESNLPLGKSGLPSSRWERSEGETLPPDARHPRTQEPSSGWVGERARRAGGEGCAGSRGDSGGLLTAAHPHRAWSRRRPATGICKCRGSKLPDGKAFYPVFHSFCTADAPAVCSPPSELKHLSPAPFPAVLHDLPAAPASLSGKENVRLLFLPLPLLKFGCEQISHVKRAPQSTLPAQPSHPFLPLLEAGGREPEQQQSSAPFKGLVQIHSGLLCGSQSAPRYP